MKSAVRVTRSRSLVIIYMYDAQAHPVPGACDYICDSYCVSNGSGVSPLVVVQQDSLGEGFNTRGVITLRGVST